jgi:hypothetical protein
MSTTRPILRHLARFTIGRQKGAPQDDLERTCCRLPDAAFIDMPPDATRWILYPNCANDPRGVCPRFLRGVYVYVYVYVDAIPHRKPDLDNTHRVE